MIRSALVIAAAVIATMAVAHVFAIPCPGHRGIYAGHMLLAGCPD